MPGPAVLAGDVPGPKLLSQELSDHERQVWRGWLRQQAAYQALVLVLRLILVCLFHLA
ncbi:hypothetical protein [Streptomyces sp. NPDC048277]|uniref:hypothetical protein n=1 Tax=Streptomyces sp. NPDC048277 TaxID=3155027 RepID=UPI003406B4B3